MIPKRILFLLILILSAKFSIAQDSASFFVAWSPGQVLFNGLRADVGIKSFKNSWLVVSPQFYYSNGNDLFGEESDYTEMTGYGLTMMYRYHIFENAAAKGPYMGFGILYNHYLVEYENFDWYETDFTGVDATTYGLVENTTEMNKIGPEILIGYQFVIGNKMMLDIYWGTGIRKSFSKFSSVEPRRFDDSMVNFGYSGIVLLTGIRFGFFL